MEAAQRHYSDLVRRGRKRGADAFDLHVAAAIAAMVLAEAETEQVPLPERIGLDSGEIAKLNAMMFPGGLPASSTSLTPDPQEKALRDILWMYSSEASAFEMLLSRMIARRCLRPNHLWQDLGLADRGELSQLMERHFARLARRNSEDMKWKKFFYRMMCSAKEFSLCAAPVCTECDDYDDCFGSEEGPALLARNAASQTRESIAS
ncbi:nitrogen fixation protein NifQ [Alteraurantiacibacter aquimixticola]|uniref:Nitrogen fixation protein NifQ n=1 Tax=Alteraurantiacibacter aquimixticola TaxID=2489173 RepID=A0A4V4U9L9_9SPHN|nr:nitrogen fixation protein NifQ [Alteraurantiacibacter aquimixticola]TIX51637.1 nitrogen fixation protein NifQ [Alteraurantiacibacter aquimixticola]